MNLTPQTKVLVQGITESPASTQAALMMKAYGTNVVAGVSPGQGGQELHGIPVFDLVEQALSAFGKIDTSVIFVHPYSVLDAALEAIAAGIQQIVIVTEGVPPLDMVRLVRKAEATETLVVGPNCPGIIVPDKLLLGTHPKEFYTPGPVGLISRSNTLTYEIALQLTNAKLGQSIGVSIGSDVIVGSSFMQWLQILDEDDSTDAIVLVGEVGSGSEDAAASYIAEAIDKPVIAYIAGRYAPKGQPLGHAGTLISSRAAVQTTDAGTAESKIAAFQEAKIPVAERISQIPELVKKALKKSG
ncbi:CoA-binding protein [Kamptonema animale CS-326]|jgi:succinyl-CoA synthetase alpha subunit|uniref:succinate--CoA ligase subunit alpha n=1 Tax=Kamptonema animale TaxID=92934 RepID=UPI00232D9A5F|nr:CoA-binding protein [Kamptonema animale]MDB9512812.1 CoA-binding protein [Kamptonema animale CS-326]